MVDSKIIEQLKPWVTAFSAAVPLKFKHGDEVCVGGEIVEIQNWQSFFGGNTFGEGKDETRCVVNIILDDAVGQTELMFIDQIYDIYNEKHKFEKGMVVIAKGRVYVSKNKKEKIGNYSNTIACGEIYPLVNCTATE